MPSTLEAGSLPPAVVHRADSSAGRSPPGYTAAGLSFLADPLVDGEPLLDELSLGELSLDEPAAESAEPFDDTLDDDPLLEPFAAARLSVR